MMAKPAEAPKPAGGNLFVQPGPTQTAASSGKTSDFSKAFAPPSPAPAPAQGSTNSLFGAKPTTPPATVDP